jgi:RarD protein
MCIKSKHKGLLEMFFATFIWGSIPLFSIWCALPSPVFVFFRVLFAFPFMFFYSIKRFGFKELLKAKPILPLILSGIVLSLNWIFFFWAINITDIATAVVLYYFGPVFTIILAVIFLKEPLNKTLVFAIIVAFAGAFLTFAPSIKPGGSVFGVFIALTSGLLYGLLGFISKIATSSHSSVKITTYQIFISIFFTSPFVFFFKFSLNLYVILLLIVTGIVHTALALFLWYDSLNYIKVSTSAVFSYLDPFFAIALGFIFLGQKPTLMQIAGLILISISGIMVSLKESAQ